MFPGTYPFSLQLLHSALSLSPSSLRSAAIPVISIDASLDGRDDSDGMQALVSPNLKFLRIPPGYGFLTRKRASSLDHLFLLLLFSYLIPDPLPNIAWAPPSSSGSLSPSSPASLFLSSSSSSSCAHSRPVAVGGSTSDLTCFLSIRLSWTRSCASLLPRFLSRSESGAVAFVLVPHMMEVSS
ncbi:hypothetical protein DFH06DRAFT_546275 [Mycena polygramma]|nr:hypothetical protein DFH06DRAFT_546275 [Mycena polygramma]